MNTFLQVFRITLAVLSFIMFAIAMYHFFSFRRLTNVKPKRRIYTSQSIKEVLWECPEGITANELRYGIQITFGLELTDRQLRNNLNKLLIQKIVSKKRVYVGKTRRTIYFLTQNNV